MSEEETPNEEIKRLTKAIKLIAEILDGLLAATMGSGFRADDETYEHNETLKKIVEQL